MRCSRFTAFAGRSTISPIPMAHVRNGLPPFSNGVTISMRCIRGIRLRDCRNTRRRCSGLACCARIFSPFFDGMEMDVPSLLLAETLRVTGLGEGLSAGLARWRAPRAVHDPGKILGDLAMTLALGGDCLADIAVLRSQPDLAGPVASDPVVSRLISALAADTPRALRAIRKARAAAREHAWALAGDRAPGADGALIPVDIDATIVIAHSDKENAAPTWKKTYGHHPLTAFADHGAGAAGEALAIMLRPGNAGSNTAAEHIETARLALAQLPRRPAAAGADPHRLRRRHA